jgi:hypothetical protein
MWRSHSKPVSSSSPSEPQLAGAELDRLIREVRDYSDVLDYARAEHPGFTEASRDANAGIVMSTMGVKECPVHMMRARAVMPCAVRDFMDYLEFEHRGKWDEYFSHGHSAKVLPGGVQLKYMCMNSPVPLLRDRDFELIVSDSYDPETGTAVLKAISTPPGSVHPVDPTGKVVRGSLLLSGFIVKPCPPTALPPVLRGVTGPCCEVTYIALVHPRGRLPPAFVNLVIGKQTSALRVLQSFIKDHPMSTLAKPAGSGSPKTKSKL